MALIECGDCGKKVSDKESACIHCGCPISASQQNQTTTKPLEADDDAELHTGMNSASIVIIGLFALVLLPILPIAWEPLRNILSNAKDINPFREKQQMTISVGCGRSTRGDLREKLDSGWKIVSQSSYSFAGKESYIRGWYVQESPRCSGTHYTLEK